MPADTVWLDSNAAGHGWFVDPTPWEDSEFAQPAGGLRELAVLPGGRVHEPAVARGIAVEPDGVGGHELQADAGSAAAGRVDLLTVLGHELGHLLGLADLD